MNKTEKKVLSYIDEHAGELCNALSQLIRFPTVNSGNGGEEELCSEYVAELFTNAGLKAEKYYPDNVSGVKESDGYLEGRNTDKRPNVSGTYYADGGTKKVMIASHTDVMPAGDLSAWTVEPFGGEIKDGKIFGRGANDNKFGIASSVMAFKAIRDCGLKLKQNVIIEAYCDEEYGGGNGALAAGIKHKCDAIVNTDGGNYEIWSCSMGGQVLEMNIETCEPQDSSELAVDALMVVRNEFKPFINARKEELANDRYFKGTDMQRSAFRFYEFSVGGGELGCNLSSGKINFVFYTNQTQEQIYKEIAEIQDRINKKFTVMGVKESKFIAKSRFFHCLSLPDENEMLQTLKGAAEEVSGTDVKITGACLSDLSVFLKYGSPVSLNFGLVRDFKLYGGAHQPDEFVEKKDLIMHCKALALFLMRWCGI